MSKVLDQLCADGLSIGTASGEFSMFCNTYSWYNTAAVGPINANGTSALNSLNLAWHHPVLNGPTNTSVIATTNASVSGPPYMCGCCCDQFGGGGMTISQMAI